MKKRLRKKKHLNEFEEFGWYVNYQFESIDQETDYAFWDMLIDKVESLELMVGGSTTSFFVHPVKRLSATATESKQQELQQWLTQQSGVTEVVSTPLTDAWYGPFQN